jgi:hypothetical protein
MKFLLIYYFIQVLNLLLLSDRFYCSYCKREGKKLKKGEFKINTALIVLLFLLSYCLIVLTVLLFCCSYCLAVLTVLLFLLFLLSLLADWRDYYCLCPYCV